jgi:hypothetical protein
MLLKTFKFYDNKGRRLSIYADYKEGDNQLKFYVFTCSKKDRFVKAQADKLYDYYIGNIRTLLAVPEWESNPQVFTVPVAEGKYKNTFMRFCFDNYFRKGSTYVEVEIEYFYKENDEDAVFLPKGSCAIFRMAK